MFHLMLKVTWTTLRRYKMTLESAEHSRHHLPCLATLGPRSSAKEHERQETLKCSKQPGGSRDQGQELRERKCYDCREQYPATAIGNFICVW